MSGGFLSDTWIEVLIRWTSELCTCGKDSQEPNPLLWWFSFTIRTVILDQMVGLSEMMSKHPGKAGLMSLPVCRGLCWSMTSPMRSPSITSGTGCATSKRYVQSPHAPLAVSAPSRDVIWHRRAVTDRKEWIWWMVDWCLQHASSDVERMLLGNKCDMNDKRQVAKERGEKVGAKPYRRATSSVLPILNNLCCRAARHRLLHQVLRNQRQGRPQRGGGVRCSSFIDTPSVTTGVTWCFLHRPSWRWPETLWADSAGRWWVRSSRTLMTDPLWIGSRLKPIFFVFHQNENNPSAGGGPVKITERRSKKNFFRCSLL